jgi:hypothetical protein
MTRSVSELSEQEFEELIGRVVDRRMQIWLDQFMDELRGLVDEDPAELHPEFATGLRRSIEQARRGEGVDLNTVRQRLGL